MINKYRNAILGNIAQLIVMAVGFLYAPIVGATLGGDASSVETDRLQMNAKYPARANHAATGNYTVHETMLPGGTLVRQYVSVAGVVFAVTWNGPFMPDLQQLLGMHFETMKFRQSGRSNAGHRIISQHESDLVIESGGHQRSFSGRAYLPASLPAGVVPSDIQ